jgi:hypothetical protein
LDRGVLQKERRDVAWRPPPSLPRSYRALLFEQGVELGAFRKPLPIASEPQPRSRSRNSVQYLNVYQPIKISSLAGNGQKLGKDAAMKFVEKSPFAEPEAAARKLVDLGLKAKGK